MHRMSTVKDHALTGSLEEYLVELCEEGRLPAQKIESASVVWEDNRDAARQQALPRVPPMEDDPF